MPELIKAEVWLLGKCDLCGTPLDHVEREGTTVWHFHEAPAGPASGMPRPPGEEPTEYMVVVPQISGGPVYYQMTYRTDGVRKPSRDEAIHHGLQAEGHDDFLIAVVSGDMLTGLAWQHGDRDDAEEVADVAAALGLTAAFTMPDAPAEEAAERVDQAWTSAQRLRALARRLETEL